MTIKRNAAWSLCLYAIVWAVGLSLVLPHTGTHTVTCVYTPACGHCKSQLSNSKCLQMRYTQPPRTVDVEYQAACSVPNKQNQEKAECSDRVSTLISAWALQSLFARTKKNWTAKTSWKQKRNAPDNPVINHLLIKQQPLLCLIESGHFWIFFQPLL